MVRCARSWYCSRQQEVQHPAGTPVGFVIQRRFCSLPRVEATSHRIDCGVVEVMASHPN